MPLWSGVLLGNLERYQTNSSQNETQENTPLSSDRLAPWRQIHAASTRRPRGVPKTRAKSTRRPRGVPKTRAKSTRRPRGAPKTRAISPGRPRGAPYPRAMRGNVAQISSRNAWTPRGDPEGHPRGAPCN